MSNIKNMEMAEAISADSRIVIKKSFLGFGLKAVYEPTQSPVKATSCYCSAETGKQLKELLGTPDEQLKDALKHIDKVEPKAIGPVRLEMLQSADGQFVALQTFYFAEFKYQPSSPLRIFEGEAAGLVSKVL